MATASMRQRNLKRLLASPDALAAHVADVFLEQTSLTHQEMRRYGTSWSASSVLFLLRDPPRCAPDEGPQLVLTKRSKNVPQPGDLCCPGGGISTRWDPWIARTLNRIPPALLGWPHASRLQPADPNRRDAALLLATAMREGFEEMRLVPRGVSFLGVLPAQRLRLLRRAIHPVVARLTRPQRFVPNWEVERVVSIPLRHLLDPERYARFRVRFEGNPPENDRLRDDFVCFRHVEGGHTEILWGATFRITMTFLQRAFDFNEPALEDLPLVRATLSAAYLTGQKRSPAYIGSPQ